MTFDLTDMLQDWDYKPGQVVARRFQGKDGEKIQLRVDLGILQMNVEGRPDGKKPMGHESWFHFYRKRAEQAPAAADGGDPDFALGSEECGRLQQESIQYHHRYICFFQLQDYAAVERDCARNLEVFSVRGPVRRVGRIVLERGPVHAAAAHDAHPGPWRGLPRAR